MTIDLIAGARPNFVKLAALFHAIKKHDFIKYRIIHTGQHYDKIMSDVFFDELEIPLPDVNLEVGSSTDIEQTANIMVKYDHLLNSTYKPDKIIVVGDVNSTLACSVVAAKSGIELIHVEAGIRSYDNKMPEEINRIITDSISNHFFTTTKNAKNILLSEGKNLNRIHFVGNVMIDTLLRNKSKFKIPEIFNSLELNQNKYSVITIHRPSNVNNKNFWIKLFDTLNKHENILFVFPCHPRTNKVLNQHKIPNNLKLITPLSYLEFNFLVSKSGLIITDSGGVTEEATVLEIPCITLRKNTERPETVEIGTNELIGNNFKLLNKLINKAFSNNWKSTKIPELWDGETAERIVKILSKI
ncbi:UDP-N-acetylglucosamine 2-epimerase (non-hydrolyzing) [Flavobacteriaceae bacterium]|nr:UDP-N-acetylglucosamine 2-epimerase (non-hydrolyzing) [Flavobacteriaceae bacterium]